MNSDVLIFRLNFCLHLTLSYQVTDMYYHIILYVLWVKKQVYSSI